MKSTCVYVTGSNRFDFPRNPAICIILELFFQRASETIDMRSRYFLGGSIYKDGAIAKSRRRNAKKMGKEKVRISSPRFSRRMISPEGKPIRISSPASRTKTENPA